jgi:hypothetical protein
MFSISCRFFSGAGKVIVLFMKGIQFFLMDLSGMAGREEN